MAATTSAVFKDTIKPKFRAHGDKNWRPASKFTRIMLLDWAGAQPLPTDFVHSKA